MPGVPSSTPCPDLYFLTCLLTCHVTEVASSPGSLSCYQPLLRPCSCCSIPSLSDTSSSSKELCAHPPVTSETCSSSATSLNQRALARPPPGHWTLHVTCPSTLSFGCVPGSCSSALYLVLNVAHAVPFALRSDPAPSLCGGPTVPVLFCSGSVYPVTPTGGGRDETLSFQSTRPLVCLRPLHLL